MSSPVKTAVIEKNYPLSPAQSEAEKGVLDALKAHFSAMTGTMREAYDAMHAKTPVAAGIATEAVNTDGIRGCWVRAAAAPADRVILFLHGGAYMLGSAAAYQGLASQLASRAGVACFVLDYPLAPEHPFPHAFDAAVSARRWLALQGFGQIALVGDSAGGALALGAMAAKDDLSDIRSVVVFSPWVDLTLSGRSFNDPATHDPIFHGPDILSNAARTYLAGADPRDGRASPLFQIPHVPAPLLIQVGTEELLLDDARRYAEAAAEKGGEVRLEIYEGLHHVFQNAVAALEAARDSLDTAASFMTSNWRAANASTER